LALAAWLEVRRYAGRPQVGYPEQQGRIYDYHTAIRFDHARDSRRQHSQEGRNHERKVAARFDD
jgi:hypothetical protein